MLKMFSKNKTPKNNEILEKKQISIDDIKDDDVMAAVLVATIDFAEETKTDVRLVSIKEINKVVWNESI